MYVSKLTIQNYRNFTDFGIDLKPFTLIIGENNSGKTNLLEALALIFSQEITIFKKRILELDDINYQAIQKFKNDVKNESLPIQDIKFPEVKVEVVMTDFNEDQEAVVGDWFINKELTEAQLTYVYRVREAWSKKEEWLNAQRTISKKGAKYVEFPIKEYEYLIYGGGESSNKADPYFLKMLKMELLDALRDAKRELIASGDYRLLYKILIHRDEKQFDNVKEIIVQLQEIVNGHPELEVIKKDIKTYLNKISLQEKDDDNAVGFTFSSPEVSEILKKLSLIYGTEPIGVDRNGLGRNNLLYLSLILSHLTGVSTGANYTFFRLVGIEEPEAHLHPHLQIHLAKNIKDEARKDLQVIITSHSPYIASKLDIENTYILYRDGTKVCEHNIFKGLTKDSETTKYLKKFLNATNSTMFFARKVILVEGIAEELLVPKLFQIYAEKTLEKIGCNIVNVNGLAFKHFLQIVKNGYFIKCIVFTDKDTGAKTENHADSLKTEYENEGGVINIQVTAQSTFEKDLIEANKGGTGKSVLLSALRNTKPIKGKEFASKTGANDIDVNSLFNEIEDYKSEFALNLLEELNKTTNGFTIPEYIKNGFDFIIK